MQNLTDARWMKAKALLFLASGVLAGLLLFAEQPTLKVALLLVTLVWSFCRAYYFTFYVVERYIDSSYSFSGLLAFAQYILRKRRSVS